MSVSTRHWYRKFSLACRDGLHFPDKPLPDAGLFIGALQDVHPHGEEKLGKNWKALAEKHKWYAETLRLAARRFKLEDGSEFRLDFPSYNTPAKIKQRMMLSLASHKRSINKLTHSHQRRSNFFSPIQSKTPKQSRPRLAIRQAESSSLPSQNLSVDSQTPVPNQVVEANDEPAIQYSQVRHSPEPQMPPELKPDEYAQMVKQLFNREGTKEELTARILQESYQKSFQKHRERCQHRQEQHVLQERYRREYPQRLRENQRQLDGMMYRMDQRALLRRQERQKRRELRKGRELQG
ncbi:hypothetical protein GGI35DRAFT_482580 [Trichoderma velutinum]